MDLRNHTSFTGPHYFSHVVFKSIYAVIVTVLCPDARTPLGVHSQSVKGMWWSTLPCKVLRLEWVDTRRTLSWELLPLPPTRKLCWNRVAGGRDVHGWVPRLVLQVARLCARFTVWLTGVCLTKGSHGHLGQLMHNWSFWETCNIIPWWPRR